MEVEQRISLLLSQAFPPPVSREKDFQLLLNTVTPRWWGRGGYWPNEVVSRTKGRATAVQPDVEADPGHSGSLTLEKNSRYEAGGVTVPKGCDLYLEFKEGSFLSTPVLPKNY